MAEEKFIFSYEYAKDKKILFGAYRSSKQQLQWIMGLSPERNGNLYNVRFNKDLFASRDGGFNSLNMPDFVVLYDCCDYNMGLKTFPCTGVKVLDEATMRALGYPYEVGLFAFISRRNRVQWS